MNDSEGLLSALGEKMLATLRESQPNLSLNERQALVGAFMADLYQMGLRTLQTPTLRQSPTLTQWIATSAQSVAAHRGDIHLFVIDTKDRIPDAIEYGHWAGIC